MALRDYQRKAVEAVKAALDRKPILVSPTGSGKTHMATALVQELALPTLWLAHRKELIDQAAARLVAHGLPVGIVMAGYAPMPLATVQVASVQTLARRDKPYARLIVIDECHHATASTYGEILDAYPGVPRVGLTATPFRLDGRGLGDLFGELVIAASTRELCDAGVLHAPKVWCSKSPDLRGVKVIAGDYNLGALAILNEIARCLNMPFNVAAGNSSGYNYSSGRLDHQTYYKAIRVDQTQMGRVVLDPILRAWLDEAVLVEGLLPQWMRTSAFRADGFRTLSHQWFRDGQEHVDPSKEASAQATRLANNTTTLAYEYARQEHGIALACILHSYPTSTLPLKTMVIARAAILMEFCKGEKFRAAARLLASTAGMSPQRSLINLIYMFAQIAENVHTHRSDVPR